MFTFDLVIEDSEWKSFTTRVTLTPGQQKSWSVVFKPEHVGEFHQSILLEIGGWRKTYSVHLNAVCDIPSIDSKPSAMFEKVCIYILSNLRYIYTAQIRIKL